MEANQDIALRAAECGVEVYATKDRDLHMHLEYRGTRDTAKVAAQSRSCLAQDTQRSVN